MSERYVATPGPPDHGEDPIAEWCEEDVRREREYFDQSPERMPGRRWEITHVYTGEVLDEVWASCAVDALARYSMSEGFADPREVAVEEPEMAGFYLHDGRLHMIITNYEVYAVEA